ncbi:MFS transporter [Nocardia arthritidis]|uniref:DHA2 family efflux MFS transporter permease subunit n=1 Tax=Nocardia arthritidis TaxID=228602 RepID=A0A6G9YIE8_9NOCA|nr:MFS transporter [Nocardia arthritidis]QIS13029.1 DHA2 family efflux MFS transporter permease subunit [Nocardia arthritidis]
MTFTAPNASGEPTVGRRAAVLAICCTAVVMANLDTTAVNVALPAIRRDLGASVAGAQWVAAGYTLVLACLLTFSGALADRIGRRTVFQLGTVIFAVGSLACGLAPSLGWLITFRIAQAVGGSMLNPVAMAIITAVFTEPRARVRAIGVWGASIGVSMAAGPVVGGLLVDAVGWGAVFLINVPIAAVAVVATSFLVPQSKSELPRVLDPIGQLLLTGTLGLLVFAIIEGPHRGWRSAVTVGCLLGAAACLTVLLRYEPRHRDPLIDPRAFRSVLFSGAFVIAALAYAALGGFLFLNTFYLQEIRGDTALRAGLSLLPMAAAMFVFGPLSGRLVAERGARIALTAGASAATGAAVLLGFTFDTSVRAALLAGYAVFGAGIGLINTPITATAVAGLPIEQAGVAASLATTSRQLGQTIGVAVIGSIIGGHPDALRSAADFHAPAAASWHTIAVLTVAALIVTRIATGPAARRTLSLPVGPRGPRPNVPPPVSRPMHFAPALAVRVTDPGVRSDVGVLVAAR